MRSDHQPANDAPYWPACVHEPGFLPWQARFVAIVNNTRPDTPTPDLVRMARMHGAVPPEWAQAVQFLMGQGCTAGAVSGVDP